MFLQNNMLDPKMPYNKFKATKSFEKLKYYELKLQNNYINLKVSMQNLIQINGK